MQSLINTLRPTFKVISQQHLITAALVVATGLLSSCANLQTVGRTTPIANGTAIHLDAQQRLVVASATGYCAEPSPDALSAYVASLGFGARGTQEREGASFLEALESNTGSIGLRTQSITLMRDALYRMCEASNNGHLSDLEVAAFLRRSQDLTAVVLAIEQLTGAVAANQVILAPGSGTTKAEELVSNLQTLDKAERTLMTQRIEIAAAEQRLLELTVARDEAAALRDVLHNELEQGHSGLEDSPEALEKRTKAAQADQTLEYASAEVELVQRELEYREDRLADTEEVVNRIRALPGDSSTVPGSDAQASPTPVHMERRADLTAEQTKAIAKAITEMVQLVVHRNDIVDLCMSYMMSRHHTVQSRHDVAPSESPPQDSLTDDQGENTTSRICRLVIRQYLDSLIRDLRKT